VNARDRIRDATGLPARHLRVRRQRTRPVHDDGFTLLETIVAISIVTIIMTALTGLFVRTIHVNTNQRNRQAAVRLVTEQADRLRGAPAGSEPTGSMSVTLNDVDYTVSWSSQACYRRLAYVGGPTNAPCASEAQQPGGGSDARYRRVTVVASWQGRACATEGCRYDDQILLSDDADPLFELGDHSGG
jgi:prepilin-type N-terminal cleavage/methylation domain-containing protein